MKALSVALLLATQAACAQPVVPVRVGGNIEIDACGAVGQVTGLKSSGDGFLAVRNGPGSSFQIVDKLHNGQLLYVCDSASDGTWLGVVYASGEDNCGVTSPIAEKRVYAGRCKTGWVSAAWVEIVAG